MPDACSLMWAGCRHTWQGPRHGHSYPTCRRYGPPNLHAHPSTMALPAFQLVIGKFLTYVSSNTSFPIKMRCMSSHLLFLAITWRSLAFTTPSKNAIFSSKLTFQDSLLSLRVSEMGQLFYSGLPEQLIFLYTKMLQPTPVWCWWAWICKPMFHHTSPLHTNNRTHMQCINHPERWYKKGSDAFIWSPTGPSRNTSMHTPNYTTADCCNASCKQQQK